MKHAELLKDANVDQAIKNIEETRDGHAFIEPLFLFKEFFASTPKPYPKRDKFIACLRKYFPSGYIPTKVEWLKGLYLAYCEALGKKLNRRIAPSIVFHAHAYYMSYDAKEMYDVFREFKYFKSYMPIRRTISSLGGHVTACIRSHFGIYTFSGDCFSLLSNYWNRQGIKTKTLYVPEDDEWLPYRKVIRFEDMKLEPRATAEALCEFLDIPFDEIVMKVTVNGEEGNMGNIRNFDTTPVYRKREEYISPFDYYRLEVAFGRMMEPWGYKPIYYTDGVQYSKKEIMKMFDIRFKFEAYHYTLRQQRLSVKNRKAFCKLVKEFLDRDLTRNEAGQKLVPIPWLKPKEEFMEGKLYE